MAAVRLPAAYVRVVVPATSAPALPPLQPITCAPAAGMAMA